MAVSVFDTQLLQHLWSTEETRAIFSEATRVQKWLDIEAALAGAQAELGLVPQDAAREIEAKASVALFDLEALGAEARRVKHALVPFLRMLQGKCAGNHGQWVHLGATTQDIIDTGMVLQIRDVHQLFLRDMAAVGAQLARLADEHRGTLMAGRTHGVMALPITFGHKCAVWLDEMQRHHERLKQIEPRMFVGMLVGAVGTQASFGPQARAVEEATLRRLGLAVPPISWAPARDRFVEYTSLLALIGGTLGKIGNELFNLQRNEFAEVEEGFTEGKTGSSTMPHKRNPVAAENIAGITRAIRYNASMMLEGLVSEHERDGIAWKTEWKALPECCIITAAALFQTGNLLRTLKVNPAEMRLNLDKMRGYLLSERVMLELGETVGKQNAHEWLYEASMHGIENKMDFADALRWHPEISKIANDAEIVRMTDPATYLGETNASIDRALANAAAIGWKTP